jgi:hypothetical protein
MNTTYRIVGPVLAASMVGEAYAQPAFASADIGRQSPPGQTVVAEGGFDVASAAGDIWDLFDSFRFVYQRVTGDFDTRTRIASLTGVTYWTKTGLMVREDLSQFGANGFMIATRSGGWGRHFFTARLAAFYGTYSHFAATFERVRYPDLWVRLVRVGDQLIPNHSTNGLAWTDGRPNQDAVGWRSPDGKLVEGSVLDLVNYRGATHRPTPGRVRRASRS